jgi:hypothetical protein
MLRTACEGDNSTALIMERMEKYTVFDLILTDFAVKTAAVFSRFRKISILTS